MPAEPSPPETADSSRPPAVPLPAAKPHQRPAKAADCRTGAACNPAAPPARPLHPRFQSRRERPAAHPPRPATPSAPPRAWRPSSNRPWDSALPAISPAAPPHKPPGNTPAPAPALASAIPTPRCTRPAGAVQSSLTPPSSLPFFYSIFVRLLWPAKKRPDGRFLPFHISLRLYCFAFPEVV